MKLVQINAVVRGSTGRIMLQTAELARENGMEVYTFSRKKPKQPKMDNHFYFGSFLENLIHRAIAQITGFSECFSFFSTVSLIIKLKKIKPDIIHLHNLHGWYINLPLLFRYIKKNNIRTVWTMHDCWSFTGHCPHFDMVGCDKWKTGCGDCPQYKDYPKSFVDNSRKLFKLKRKWFTGVNDLTIVTPSQWLADLVKQSFLKDYPVKVINNGINLDIFKPTPSDFRKKYDCENKYIVLGVAFGWGERKGLDVFIELSKKLPDNYKIVLVGTNDSVDKLLPDNIISIHRTQNQKELAEIYSAADLFVNPTREETYPTVNMEALACGTPILTFRTGGSPEIIDETCGAVVPKNDIEKLYSELLRISEERPFSTEACLERAKGFAAKASIDSCIGLYIENDQE